MTEYLIECRRIRKDNSIIDTIIFEPEKQDLWHINGKIKDYAEAWRKEAVLIHHHAGQSIIYFKSYRKEYTRTPKPLENY